MQARTIAEVQALLKHCPTCGALLQQRAAGVILTCPAWGHGRFGIVWNDNQQIYVVTYLLP